MAFKASLCFKELLGVMAQSSEMKSLHGSFHEEVASELHLHLK